MTYTKHIDTPTKEMFYTEQVDALYKIFPTEMDIKPLNDIAKNMIKALSDTLCSLEEYHPGFQFDSSGDIQDDDPEIMLCMSNGSKSKILHFIFSYNPKRMRLHSTVYTIYIIDYDVHVEEFETNSYFYIEQYIKHFMKGSI